MKRARLLCCASDLGEIHLRDPKTLKIEHVLPAHLGGIYDMSVAGNMLITCGFTERHSSTLPPFPPFLSPPTSWN